MSSKIYEHETFIKAPQMSTRFRLVLVTHISA